MLLSCYYSIFAVSLLHGPTCTQTYSKVSLAKFGQKKNSSLGSLCDQK